MRGRCEIERTDESPSRDRRETHDEGSTRQGKSRLCPDPFGDRAPQRAAEAEASLEYDEVDAQCSGTHP